MSEKISRALSQLSQALTLAKHQRTLKPEAIQIHQAILYAYAHTGAAPLVNELALANNRVPEILEQLRQLDLILLDDNAEICGAYPFTSEARVHRVEINGHSAHCMCALDALAISPMFNCDALIQSECALSATPVIIIQSGHDILNGQQCTEVFVAINWGAISGSASCANSLCKEMNFISGAERAHDWQMQSDQHELFTLVEAIEFAALFFMPLLPQPRAV